MGYKCTLLAVHEEELLLHLLKSLLAQEFELLTAATPAQARGFFAQHPIDIVLTGQQFPKTEAENETGTQFLDWVRLYHPAVVRILITPRGEIDPALDAINQGQAQRLLLNPWQTDALQQTIRQAARAVLLERSHEELIEKLRLLNLELEQRVQVRTGQLEEANRQLQYKNSILERMALTDPLTELPNRRSMDRLVRAELQRRARRPDHLTLAIVDVDHFKDVNTRYLLPGGDHVLVWLAQSLSQAVRTTDTVGRIGGEEFMVLAPGTNSEGAMVLAERIRKRIEETETVYQQQPIRITVSIGVAVAPEEVTANYEQLKMLASNALAEAKATGRNRSVVQTLEASL